MQSSRDSSVWRSLAVAFGDGVAFGVGVKLSQSAASHVNATALADPSPAREPESPEMASRLEEFERRLAKMEQAKTLPPVHAQFDQKVLEAVVNALDARLKEQAGAVERRIAELEARLTIELTALRRQDETIAAAVEDHMEKLQDHFIAQVEAVRQQVEQDHAAMHEEVAASVRKASELAIEEKIAPVREAAAEKDRDLAALRQRLEDSEHAMVELLNGIGNVLRVASERRTSGAPGPTAATASESATDPNAGGPEPPSETQPPSFAQGSKPARLWRVPLVSSILVGAFGLVIAHFF